MPKAPKAPKAATSQDAGCAATAAALAVTGCVGARRASARKGPKTPLRVFASVERPEVAVQSWRNLGVQWGVHKFGGASLNNAELYKICGDLLIAESKSNASSGKDQPTAAIVSAAGGMTDMLVAIINSALTSVEESREKLRAAADRQKSILLELLPDKPEITDKVIANIDKDQDAVEAMALAASQMRGVPPQMMELVAGLGEVWSAQTLCAYMNSAGVRCEWIDARDCLIVPDGPLSGLGEKGTAIDTIEPFWDETSHRLQNWWESTVGEADAPFLVITGFVCSTVQGRPTTLKRSGSDYSATIFAKILDASNVTFWKNVSGVYTADPRQVPEAFPINSMTFDEAMELAYFGGQVLHPSAMVPCIENRIPVLVKNVFDPAHPGTRVYGRGDAVLRWDDQTDDGDEQMPVKAITSIEKVSLITIAGTSFMGTHGVAKRFMEALSSVGVNVILTSQGSSEHSITVAVADTDGKMAMQAVESAFQLEIARNAETRATKLEGLSILAVIGEGMKNSTGISGRFFNALGRSKVNIVAIAQGSSERNISAVVSREDLSLALRATHDAFLMKESTISVSVVGGGEIGTAFVRQLARWSTDEGRDFALPSLREVQYINIDLRSFCDSNKMLLAQKGLPLTKLQENITNGVFNLKDMADEWEKSGKAVSDALSAGVEMADTDLEHFIQFTESKEYPHKVIVDCSSSADIAAKYPEWLRRGFHVVTPNRSALIGPYQQYEECLQQVGKRGAAQFRYDATVGGQIPIITLLQDLLQTGDRIHRLTGVLSGTLSYVFNKLNLEPGTSFSEAYKQACDRELTNVVPEEDLNGTDSARKALILARELGLKVEISDVEIESLLPSDAEGGDIIASIKEKIDPLIAEKMKAASEKGELIFYSAEVDVEARKVTVGLKGFPSGSPPFALNDADMAIQMVSDRFPESTPLVCRGPGAGAEYTASGLFASMLRVCRTVA